MECNEIKEVREFLASCDFRIAYEASYRSSDKVVIIAISSDDVESKASNSKTSMKQLKSIKKKAESAFEAKLEFTIYKGDVQKRHESSISDILAQKYSLGASCSISIKEGAAEVWLNIEHTETLINDELIVSINGVITDYFNLYGITTVSVNFTEVQKERPNLLLIMSVVKKFSPIKFDKIKIILDRDHFVPSEQWLNKELDKMRKNDFLIRQSDGTFVLTEEGLKVSPHGAYSLSSDIDRALFIARSKW